MSDTARTDDLRIRFKALHARDCFVMPNPWDVGSARLLASLGFSALATTSSGFAWTQGRADNHVPLADVLGHLTRMCAAVDVPINADFEGGFAVDPEDVAVNVAAACGTGVAGLSIEDSTGDEAQPLFDFSLAVARVKAARSAVEDTGVVLTARSEGFLVGRPDLRETVRRLQAFAEAGADCLYAPGLRDRDQIATVILDVAPLPVNVLVSSDFVTVREVADLGARRISVGGALARVAWKAVIDAATEIAKDGTFTRLAQAASGAELNQRFAAKS